MINWLQCCWMQQCKPKILMVKINSVYAKYSSHTVRIVTKLHTSGYFCSSNKILANLLQNYKTMPIKTPKYQFFDTLGIAQNWKSRHIINIIFGFNLIYEVPANNSSKYWKLLPRWHLKCCLVIYTVWIVYENDHFWKILYSQNIDHIEQKSIIPRKTAYIT